MVRMQGMENAEPLNSKRHYLIRTYCEWMRNCRQGFFCPCESPVSNLAWHCLIVSYKSVLRYLAHVSRLSRRYSPAGTSTSMMYISCQKFRRSLGSGNNFLLHKSRVFIFVVQNGQVALFGNRYDLKITRSVLFIDLA